MTWIPGLLQAYARKKEKNETSLTSAGTYIRIDAKKSFVKGIKKVKKSSKFSISKMDMVWFNISYILESLIK